MKKKMRNALSIARQMDIESAGHVLMFSTCLAIMIQSISQLS